jgi:hypothetical protein
VHDAGSEPGGAHIEGRTVVVTEAYATTTTQGHFDYQGQVDVRWNWDGTTWQHTFSGCSLDNIQSDTGQTLGFGPDCKGEWAVGWVGDCGEQCEHLDVFHVSNGKWSYLGGFQDLCPEGLTASDMPLTIAEQFVSRIPEACPPRPNFVDEPPTGPLHMGHHGTRVLALQTALREAGYTDVTADGYFGDVTDTAIRSLQAANGLKVDGIAGPDTYQTLGLVYP